MKSTLKVHNYSITSIIVCFLIGLFLLISLIDSFRSLLNLHQLLDIIWFIFQLLVFLALLGISTQLYDHPFIIKDNRVYLSMHPKKAIHINEISEIEVKEKQMVFLLKNNKHRYWNRNKMPIDKIEIIVQFFKINYPEISVRT
jgi:hypothetical protein